MKLVKIKLIKILILSSIICSATAVSQNYQETKKNKIESLYVLIKQVQELSRDYFTLQNRLRNQKAFGEETINEATYIQLKSTELDINHIITLYFIYENSNKDCLSFDIDKLLTYEIENIKTRLEYSIKKINSGIELDVRESVNEYGINVKNIIRDFRKILEE